MKDLIVYRELGEKVAQNIDIEYVCAYNGKLFLHTKLELQGRGIKKHSNGETHKRGLKSYYATEKAMAKLKEKYNCAYMANL